MQKLFIFLALVSLCLCELDMERQRELVKEINSRKTTWVAQENPIDVVPLLGTFLDKGMLPPPRNIAKRNDLPESFDLREKYPDCLSLKEIRDQANCGSCWAFSTTEVMSDRICIASGQKLQTKVSTQHVVTCCQSCGFGCNGGWPATAFSFWQKKGVPTGGAYNDTATCKPYFLPPCAHHVESEIYKPCPDTVDTPDCTTECVPEYGKKMEEDLTYGNDSYSIDDDEEAIMTEIYERGSVSAAFEVYEDFPTYKSGVYQHETGRYLGGHAIKIIGWGVEDGVKYWLCVNSWNESWGDKGLFKILRGEDECGIEGEIVAGTPKLE